MRTRRTASTVSDRGVGLIEVIVAVVLLGVLTSIVLAIVLQSQAATVNNRSRVAASNLAAREIDFVREQFAATDTGPIDIISAGVVTNPHSFGAAGSPLVVDGTPYTVKRSVAWNVTGSGSSACEGGSVVPYPTMNVRVEVTWPNMGSTKPVVSTTNLAPPKGTGLSTTKSYVAVKVTNAAGKVNPGRSVTVYATSGGESRSGLTDESGCAVLEVNPAAGTSGTSYSVRLTDSGHVDISGNPSPVRLVGNVVRGALNSSIDMSFDRAASVTVRIVGGGVIDSDVNGSSVSLYQSEFAGASAISSKQVTGVSTTIGGLWPTSYGAFFGTEVPPEFTTVQVAPGGSASIDVPITLASFTMSATPPGATIIAVPNAQTSCTAPGARPIDPAAGQLIPGSWRFFAQAPAYGCSPGPSNVAFIAGDNGDSPWGTTTLQVNGAGAAVGQGPIWAVSNANVAATCTVPNPATDAVLVGEAPSASVVLPAGDWYLFSTPANGAVPAAGQPCISAGLVNVAHGTTTTFTWPGTGATP